MPNNRQNRKHQLERMTREAIVTLWQKLADASDSGSTRFIPTLIDEILEKEFPTTESGSQKKSPDE